MLDEEHNSSQKSIYFNSRKVQDVCICLRGTKTVINHRESLGKDFLKCIFKHSLSASTAINFDEILFDFFIKFLFLPLPIKFKKKYCLWASSCHISSSGFLNRDVQESSFYLFFVFLAFFFLLNLFSFFSQYIFYLILQVLLYYISLCKICFSFL